jgi:divalent metal cation (Fe/Co/Zn/Cd) transporter
VPTQTTQTRKTTQISQTTGNLRAGLHVSQASLAWTAAAGGLAIGVGIVGSSLSLVTFGLIGLLDGVGSASLIVHFRHSLRHEAVSQRHERLALAIVTAGLAIIGAATVGDSVERLATHASGRTLVLGTSVAAASSLVLAALSVGKQRVARRIPSHALHSDGWVSAVGAVLALVVLVGAAVESGLGLWWVDPIAAIVIACGAVSLSIVLWRGRDADAASSSAP